MIKKLRLKFIIAALLSIFLVLAATIASINISNYIKAERDTSTLLDQVVDRERESLVKQNSFDYTNRGQGGQQGGFNPGGQQSNPGPGQTNDPNQGEQNNPPDKPEEFHFTESDPDKDDPRGQYFVSVFSTDGSVEYTYFHMISTDKEADQQMAIDIYKSEKEKGKIGNYTYKRITKTDVATQRYYSYTLDSSNFRYVQEEVENKVPFEATYIAFVDNTESARSVNNFIVSSIVVAAVSYTVLVALIIASSHFVFKTSEESYHKQKAFITNASHELKTPLTIINTDVEILKMDNGENEWTDSISDQVRRLTMMTNQLVTLSKLDEGNLKNYPFSLFSLSKVAKETADAFMPTYEKAGFKFTCEIEDAIEVKANQYLINELFYIFLDNAFKYTTPQGEISFTVKKNTKNKLEITFTNDTDDDEVDVNLLFERFYRSPHASNNKKEGSGIGLSIAKEIVDLHKGKVSVTLKEGKISFVIIF